MNEMKFPDGFYWGAATASYQVEGGIYNCDWAKAATEGRVPLCGIACDHYNRYEEDFDLAKSLGHTAHRFSIEWARIEPEEGQFNQEEIEHYRKVIKALKERNITPFVTLWHFTLPLWFSESGGFERKDSPQIFARYAEVIAKELGEELAGITTMNEPVVFAGLGWLKGNWPPFKMQKLADWQEYTNSGDRSQAQPYKSWGAYFTYRKVVNNLVKAHNLASIKMKAVQPQVQVSVVKHVVAFDATNNPWQKLKAHLATNFQTHSFMKRVAKHCDVIGLNFYHYVLYGNRGGHPKSDMGWEMIPGGIYRALQILHKYKKPIFVSECGVADDDDSHRAWYIKEQVKGVKRAIDDGIDVRGHLYWSLMDNYEWALGFEKKFGLIEIDYDTLERKVRPSAYVYKEICERNAVVE